MTIFVEIVLIYIRALAILGGKWWCKESCPSSVGWGWGDKAAWHHLGTMCQQYVYSNHQHIPSINQQKAADLGSIEDFKGVLTMGLLQQRPLEPKQAFESPQKESVFAFLSGTTFPLLVTCLPVVVCFGHR